MLSMTSWTWLIKTVLRSKRTRNSIRDEILENCTLKGKSIYGGYLLDDDKVWETVVMPDPDCRKRLEELHISGITGLESYYEQIQYSKMRGTFPHSHHKKG